MRFTTDNSDLARVRFLQQTAFHRSDAEVGISVAAEVGGLGGLEPPQKWHWRG